MRINVLDDKWSVLHVLLGVLAYFLPAVFLVFLFYELAEYLYKRRETAREFVGDLFEFFYGLGMTRLIVYSIFGSFSTV